MNDNTEKKAIDFFENIGINGAINIFNKVTIRYELIFPFENVSLQNYINIALRELPNLSGEIANSFNIFSNPQTIRFIKETIIDNLTGKEKESYDIFVKYIKQHIILELGLDEEIVGPLFDEFLKPGTPAFIYEMLPHFQIEPEFIREKVEELVAEIGPNIAHLKSNGDIMYERMKKLKEEFEGKKLLDLAARVFRLEESKEELESMREQYNQLETSYRTNEKNSHISIQLPSELKDHIVDFMELSHQAIESLKNKIYQNEKEILEEANELIKETNNLSCDLLKATPDFSCDGFYPRQECEMLLISEDIVCDDIEF